jgi:hypothetical protein
MLEQGRSIGEFNVYSIDTDVMVMFWVSIATVVCKNKRLKYVMLMDTDDNDVCKMLTKGPGFF